MTFHPLPTRLPPGERVLWRGTPDWRGIARDALHLRGVATYCGLLVAALAAAEAYRGLSLQDVAADTAIGAVVAAVPVLLGLAYAWFSARSATYTVTDHRVVIRMGVAVQMTMNLPFSRINAAGVRARPGNTGEIRLQLVKGERQASSLLLWPHARLGHAEPVLRALKDADKAGQVLARALAASANMPVTLASLPETVETAPIGDALAA